MNKEKYQGHKNKRLFICRSQNRNQNNDCKATNTTRKQPKVIKYGAALFKKKKSILLSVGFCVSMAIREGEWRHLRPPKTQRPPACPCSPEGLFQRDVTPSWLGLFSTCVMLAFCMLSATMQIPWGAHAKIQTLLSLSHTLFFFSCHTHSASVPRWLYGCSLFDVFPCLNIPPFSSSSLPPFLPFSLLSLPSFVRHRFTLDQPRRDSWLQSATSFISHSSEREGDSALG